MYKCLSPYALQNLSVEDFYFGDDSVKFHVISVLSGGDGQGWPPTKLLSSGRPDPLPSVCLNILVTYIFLLFLHFA